MKFLKILAGSGMTKLDEGIGIIAVDLKELRGLLLLV